MLKKEPFGTLVDENFWDVEEHSLYLLCQAASSSSER